MERKRCRAAGVRGVDCTSGFTRVAVSWLLTAGLACLPTGCGSSDPVVPVPGEAEWSDMDGIQFTRVEQTREPFESSKDWLVE